MVNLIKKINSIIEIRTGFVASSCAILGVAFGFFVSGNINIIASISFVISAFLFNIVANVAAEIGGYVSGEDYGFQTNHKGSEGLVRGDVNLKEAIICLCLFLISAIGFGLLALFYSREILLLIIGVIGVFGSLLYSLTILAYNKLPITEFVSGFMCGYLCTIAGFLIQTPLELSAHLLGVMTLLMVSFLMAANNTTDFEKDLKRRVTLPHIIGFRNSIIILIPQIILLYGLWFIISMISINNFLICLLGVVIVTYFGIFKWYIHYFQVKEYSSGLSKVYGPMPLRLLLNFNIIMAVVFMIVRIYEN